jgi:hypothetical protein
MKIARAFLSGLGRVASAPAILAGLYLVTVGVALPFAGAMRGLLERHLDHSMSAAPAATGVDYDWWQEFETQASGLGETFTPAIIGFAAPLGNVSDVADDIRMPAAIAGAVAAYLLVWAFLVGGVLDRYARRRPTRPAGFFAVSGVFFLRFMRLGLMALAFYALLFGPVHRWLLEDLYGRLTHDVAVERSAFFIRLALYTLFGLLLCAVNVVFDYAKVRAVVEDRRSMIGALRAGARFVTRKPLETGGLYLINALLFGFVLVVYAAVAPGVWGTGWSLWRGFLIGQLYVLARLGAKLVFYASEVAFFQGELAHAGYTAAPVPRWPESPAAEAIGNAAPGPMA